MDSRSATVTPRMACSSSGLSERMASITEAVLGRPKVLRLLSPKASIGCGRINFFLRLILAGFGYPKSWTGMALHPSSNGKPCCVRQTTVAPSTFDLPSASRAKIRLTVSPLKECFRPGRLRRASPVPQNHAGERGGAASRSCRSGERR